MIANKEISKVGFIGSGKVATQLAISFYDRGIDVAQIYSRNFDNALTLAKKTGAAAISEISGFDKDLDLIVISISDSAFGDLELFSLPQNTLIVHTSGSLSIDVLRGIKNHGVFYPLQTFNMYDKPNWDTIPICIEANTENNIYKLKNLARLFSKKIFDINSKERAILHLSAVFVCNFTNALYAIGEEILDKNNISFDLLRPLIEETAKKTMIKSPKLLQTGPAVRNDRLIIDKHIQSLADNTDYAKIYKLMSKIIYKQQNNN